MHITRYGRSLKKAIVLITALTGFLVAFLIPFYTKSMLDAKVGYYTISINGVTVGAANSKNDVEEAFALARKKLSSQYSGDVYMNPEIVIQKEDRKIADRSTVNELSDEIYSYLFDNVLEVERNFNYVLKVADTTITMASLDDINTVLEKVMDSYDTLSQYNVEIASSEEVNGGYVVNLVKSSSTNAASDIVAAAVGGDGATVVDATDITNEGVTSIRFVENITIYAVPEGKNDVVSVDDAYQTLTKATTVNQSYIVTANDTLQFIADKYGVTVDKIVSLNPKIKNGTILVEGDIITVPYNKTLLTVETTRRMSFQEDYNETPNYSEDNTRNKYDNAVTTSGTTGQRYIEAEIVYNNDTELQRKYISLGSYVLSQAEPSSISVGTLSSSNYARPLKSEQGTLKSGFLDGDLDNGVEWSVDVGTDVLASADGKVTKAGWYSNYGYMVEITHSDGSITRYGHLSEIKVSVGDSVTKGNVIALTGNTGVATDNELLFEIIINGSYVNPLDYVNQN